MEESHQISPASKLKSFTAKALKIGRLPQKKGANVSLWNHFSRVSCSFQAMYQYQSLLCELKYFRKLVIEDSQLMVNWWFGLVVWDSIGMPLSNNPFHKGILGIQTSNPNHQLTIS